MACELFWAEHLSNSAHSRIRRRGPGHTNSSGLLHIQSHMFVTFVALALIVRIGRTCRPNKQSLAAAD